MRKTIPAGLVLALLATLATVAPAAAWHVDVGCEEIRYVQWEYKVFTADGQEVTDGWTDQDTDLTPGTYIVKFKNGEKSRVEIEACPAPSIVASGMLCGDPRAWVRYDNTGNVAVDTRLTFLPGDKTKPSIRKYVRRTIPAGATRVVGPRWVRGQVRVQVRIDGAWQRLFSYKVGKTLRPKGWDRGGCPSDRFGSPAWTTPHITGAYGRLTIA